MKDPDLDRLIEQDHHASTAFCNGDPGPKLASTPGRLRHFGEPARTTRTGLGAGACCGRGGGLGAPRRRTDEIRARL